VRTAEEVLLATCCVRGDWSFVFAGSVRAQLVWGSSRFPAEQVESAFPLGQAAGVFFLFQLLNLRSSSRTLAPGWRAVGGCTGCFTGWAATTALPKGLFGKIEAKRQIPQKRDLDRRELRWQVFFSLL